MNPVFIYNIKSFPGVLILFKDLPIFLHTLIV